ncbi:nucleoside diphosphate kinase 6-like isoform X2 [Pseudomyrmex gracilis]|uniref:nucleoside diphosphate kinase 6-like isoform X2 n=1 Tax=Pseudomyrmex gracilis TaxID=219809 RepID=UPI000995530E|nr:nucleoside diphosphate kinase 6-like isoform X2 [Pseudomyrmex gracilis]
MQSGNLQLTLAILKPHILKCPFALQVVRSRRTLITREEAELFYKEHRNKFFYNRLLTFMCSEPSDIHILTAHDAILKWRQLMGPTKVYQAQYDAPNTIRGMFGLSDTKNAAHGSDSIQSAEKEITIFFKEFNMKSWYENEEIFFKLGKLHFDPISFMHTVDKSYKE